MNWITRWKKIGIKVKQIFKKQPIGQEATDWKTCPQCKKITYKPDLFENFYICECSFHHDMPPKLRLNSLFDSNYEIIEPSDAINPDPLDFQVKDGAREGYKYINKIKKYRKVTGQHTALLCASGQISNLNAVVVCFNPKFGAGRFGPAGAGKQERSAPQGPGIGKMAPQGQKRKIDGFPGYPESRVCPPPWAEETGS